MKNKTILIVDDEPMSVKTLCHHLKNKYSVIMAQGGFEALEVLSHTVPDLILLDLIMPVMDGYEVYRTIRMNPAFDCVPVVFITSLTDIECEAEGLKMGACDYIHKPFDADLVLLRIKQHLSFSQERWLLLERSTELQALNATLEQRVIERTVELETSNARLEEACDAAEAANVVKRSFLANMSHEIRTPMNAIIGMTHLAKQTNLTPKQNEYLHKVGIAANSLLGIINDMLDFSKIEAGQLEIEEIDFLIEEVLGRVVAIVSPSIQIKKLQFLIDVEPGLPSPLVGDSLRLGQILLNLVTNSVKFTNSGKIVLSVRQEWKENDRVSIRFSVCDSGVGMSTEEQLRLFEPFTQADVSTTRTHGGTGLGLAICRQLVQIMGGEITVSSSPGGGSEFSFTVDFAIGKEMPLVIDTMTRADGMCERAAIRGARVLLVEDNELNQQVAIELLQSAGLSVTLAVNGEHALEKLRNETFAAVFMDIQMPVMDGIEATRRLRRMPGLGELPVIAMTAHAMAQDRQHCLDVGMNDHIAKPIHPEELARLLVRWVPPLTLHTPEVSAANLTPHDTAQLPETIPGIDMALGLKMCNDNGHLYLEMLHKFRRNKRYEDEKIRALLGAGDRGAACRAAHNIKSVAGLIGAADLSIAACALEESISASGDELPETQLNIFAHAFKLVIRSLDAELAAAGPLPGSHLRYDDRQQTILIVDDTEMNARILTKVLCDEYNIVVASNGKTALEMASGTSPPDLILLDILMPGMSGYDVCARLKADPRTAAIPVIFVSGLSGESDEQSGLELGAVDFIQKPFSPSLVRARVRNHLELQKHRTNLEKLVHDRTAELEVNNINLAKEIAIRSRTEAAMKEQAVLLVEQVNERLQAQEKLLIKQQQLAELNAGLEDMVADEVRKNREKDGIMLHQDKLASIGHLAAGVAHEINNPMGFIMSNLGTLKGYVEKLGQFTSLLQTIIVTDGSVEKQRIVEEAAQGLDINYILEDLGILIAESTEGAERVKQIVLDLKDFARTDQVSFKEADLNGCVRSTVNIVRNEIRYVADLDLQLGDIPPVLCNPQQINQVIANLLVNAAHAIEGHGTITVCTRHEPGIVILTVSDTGCGVPPEIRSLIFDPFFTTKDPGKGTGLGLNICYNIVKKHAGEITLESELGVGTTFTVTLPVSAFGESKADCITASLPD